MLTQNSTNSQPFTVGLAHRGSARPLLIVSTVRRQASAGCLVTKAMAKGMGARAERQAQDQSAKQHQDRGWQATAARTQDVGAASPQGARKGRACSLHLPQEASTGQPPPGQAGLRALHTLPVASMPDLQPQAPDISPPMWAGTVCLASENQLQPNSLGGPGWRREMGRASLPSVGSAGPG